ncbi:glycosyltransferase family 15 protein [Conidiobolus coronatus NRRL 28638]|uniref:Glycosyltransferase family 15 protein n=1 Tax=Conidiobolus coronatus (strain ATCC 28846 / CBS 209.66 / NRRL 28638) TaxID=796925 RepID=A0A137PB04_CONC2|nr:glycosyltransferase family 15 protein [Conidiobolus coronatus NRRL 28638]|eukprot:KXN72197.1 glycosyltransferase family 15 protein [Conidiobolus coronatus NRRL 28638]
MPEGEDFSIQDIVKLNQQRNKTPSDLVEKVKGKQIGKTKSAFVVLVRNSELEDWVASMRELEDRFNHRYNYPYVFLNEQNFTQEFMDRVRHHTNAEVKFGLVPKEHWSIPSWIDKEKAKKLWSEASYSYGDSESYRHMCRYESGFFFRHPLLDGLDYYWRVEPGVHFMCDIKNDPFEYMQNNNKKYGFTITWKEFMDTIPTLYSTVKDYIKEKNLEDKLPKDNAKNFLNQGKNGDEYNGCHFWTNFEIGALDVWRSKEYLDFFEYLDKKGGFFYERWGDAPVHSIYLSLFLPKSQVHFFDEIGYQHNNEFHCPSVNWLENNCHCDRKKTWDLDNQSCAREWKDTIEL